MNTWILLPTSIILSIVLIDNSLLLAQASNSTKILPPKESEDLTTQDRVLIKLTPSGTTSQANVSPKNIKVKVGTTVVWQNMLPEKVYVQSKPDENHYEGQLLNGSYFFPGESREEKLNKIGTFIYDGSNGFGSYYVRGTVTVVEKATEVKKIPIKTIQNQSAQSASFDNSSTTNTSDFRNGDLGLTFKYPAAWNPLMSPDYKNCFKNSNSCNVSFSFGNSTSNNAINFIIGVRVSSLIASDPTDSSNSNIIETCLCSSLEDYIKWDYNRLFKENDVIADNRTIIGENHPAWQMEVFQQGQ